jgi:alanyl-tRNA synthetase
MTQQRDRAKQDARDKKTGGRDTGGYRGVADSLGRPVEFTGYEEVSSEGRVAGLLVAGDPVPVVTSGQDVEIVLDRTPFYAESGGQLADQGLIQLSDGGLVEVLDVQSPMPGVVVHRAHVSRGEVTTGVGALGQVDVDRRRAISRAHTATHLVHKAFRDALGETATQAGSENAPGRQLLPSHRPGLPTSSTRSTRCSPPTSRCTPRS